MEWRVDWDENRLFVVGGEGGRRLSPNFKLREFRRADGTVKVHRELVSALQLLRTKLGKSLRIRSTDEDGLGAVVFAADVDRLLTAADSLEAHKLFAAAERDGDDVHVRIPDPANLPKVGLEQALETAFSVTAAYETIGDKFRQITGNFDGAGISFGPAQFNFKSKTLVPLFEKFREADEAALKGCFTDDDDWEEWNRVLALPSRREQIEWAERISVGSNKANVMQPWRTYFRAVGKVPAFRVIMVEETLRKYGRKLLRDVRFLQDLRPGIEIDHLRCICALYDATVQQGGLPKAEDRIRERVARESPADQFALVQAAVEERGKVATRKYRADCISRRLGILQGAPKTVEESGERAQRTNINSFMLRDVRVEGAAQTVAMAETQVDEELERVGRALAVGDTLLA